MRRSVALSVFGLIVTLVITACVGLTRGVQTDPSVRTQQGRTSFDEETDSYMKKLYEQGQKIFETTHSAQKRSGAISSNCIGQSSARRKAASEPASVHVRRSSSA
jgi:hypothetical protein